MVGCMPEPTPCDLLITGGTVLDLDRADGRIDATVAVTEGIVVAVDPAPDAAERWAPQRTIAADGAYVAAGFVDGHIHLSAVLGAAQYLFPGYFALVITLHDSDGFDPFCVYPAPWLDSLEGVGSEPVPDVVEAGSEP